MSLVLLIDMYRKLSIGGCRPWTIDAVFFTSVVQTPIAKGNGVLQVVYRFSKMQNRKTTTLHFVTDKPQSTVLCFAGWLSGCKLQTVQ